MDVRITSFIDNYLFDHELRFRNYICQTDLFYPDGTVNQDGIIVYVHSDATKLCAMFKKETIIILNSQIKNHIDKNEFRHIAHLLFFCHWQNYNRIPLSFAILTSHGNLFEIYSNALHTELNSRLIDKGEN